jgi:translation initiation factor 2 subunit 2
LVRFKVPESPVLTLSDAQLPERKARKSVQFTDQKLVIDEAGSVSMVSTPNEEPKEASAVSHAPSTPPLSSALVDFADPMQSQAGEAAENADDGGLDLSLMKKKKKKPKKEVDEEPEAAEDDEAPADDGGLDLTLKKKKKKKKVEGDVDDFAARVAALELKGEDGEEADAGEQDEGNWEDATGIWSHDATPTLPYAPLVDRFYVLLEERNPDHAQSGTRSYKIPPPQCLREGNKKTIFANLVEISKRMKRSEEHVTSYLFAELGTTGSIDGSKRLVIRGRFQQKQIENVLRNYIKGSSLSSTRECRWKFY